MQFKDNCAICLTNMSRGTVARRNPCQHMFHRKCINNVADEPDPSCPVCRSNLQGVNDIQRGTYQQPNADFRRRIVECANRGGDWVTLVSTLEVRYKTAYGWVRQGEPVALKRGGVRPPRLTPLQKDEMISWIEDDCQLTLTQIKHKDFLPLSR